VNCTCSANTEHGARTTPTTNPLLRDIHIVMIGDSLMRYQYLSLVYRLRYGVWFDESKWYYNLVNERTFEDPYHSHTWGEFLFHTNRILQPYEVCDCYRRVKKNWKSDVVENRYYFDHILNNSIVYVQAFGHELPLSGRLEHQVQQVTNNRTWQMGAMHQSGILSWKYNNWPDFIRSHVQHLDPQPRHIVMNAGAWKHSFGFESNHEKESHHHNLSQATIDLVRTMQDTPQYQYVWRTTTYRKDRSTHHNGLESDRIMCGLDLMLCVNVSYTRHVRQDLYWDNVHFFEPVYRVENEQMLDLLGYLPSDYEQMNASTLFE
jgi:hypothetical protein